MLPRRVFVRGSLRTHQQPDIDHYMMVRHNTTVETTVTNWRPWIEEDESLDFKHGSPTPIRLHFGQVISELAMRYSRVPLEDLMAKERFREMRKFGRMIRRGRRKRRNRAR